MVSWALSIINKVFLSLVLIKDIPLGQGTSWLRLKNNYHSILNRRASTGALSTSVFITTSSQLHAYQSSNMILGYSFPECQLMCKKTKHHRHRTIASLTELKETTNFAYLRIVYASLGISKGKCQ